MGSAVNRRAFTMSAPTRGSRSSLTVENRRENRFRLWLSWLKRQAGAGARCVDTPDLDADRASWLKRRCVDTPDLDADRASWLKRQAGAGRRHLECRWGATKSRRLTMILVAGGVCPAAPVRALPWRAMAHERSHGEKWVLSNRLFDIVKDGRQHFGLLEGGTTQALAKRAKIGFARRTYEQATSAATTPRPH